MKIGHFSAIIFMLISSFGCSSAPQRKPANDTQPNRPHDAQATCGIPGLASCESPTPLLDQDSAVDWWFVFKFNSASFPGCGDGATPSCLFGTTVQKYANASQQFVYASSDEPTLQQGGGCAGDTTTDPVGATFNEIYNGSYYYVIWNDQFYDDPKIAGCSQECGSPWGHSKGVVAWNDAGDGMVMQVSTPSWPASGSPQFPRKTDGNTLGCVKDDDVEFSQHFFSLKLNKDDLVAVLNALSNASVVTDPKNKQIVNNGGPADVQALVSKLGVQSSSKSFSTAQLSTGVQLISKPSNLNVPPWQMVSAILGGTPLRAATWWETPEIPSTTDTTEISCWDKSLGKPGAVEIATSGVWDDKKFGLTGGLGADFNHAKIGVSTSDSSDNHYSIFADMNQQGTLSGNCKSSQNGRGGTFWVVDDEDLSESVADLIGGDTAPTEPAAPPAAPAKAPASNP